MGQPNHKPQQSPAQQHGFIIPLLLVLLVGVTVLAVSNLIDSSNAANAKREQQTSQALAQAKEAVLAFLVAHNLEFSNTMHTNLNNNWITSAPCPDIGNSLEGIYSKCGSTDFSSIGRFAWHTLDLPVLRDGDGECLWYVVSGHHKAIPLTEYINTDTPSLLQLTDANGNQIGAVDNQTIAVIFSAGKPLPNQDRTRDTAKNTELCGGNYVANNYLESVTLSNVANGVSTIIQDIPSNTRNDRIVTITQNEVRARLNQRKDFHDRMRRIADKIAVCLAAATNLPQPTPLNLGNQWGNYMGADNYTHSNIYFGRVPAKWILVGNHSTQNCPSLYITDTTSATSDSDIFLYRDWKDHFFYGIAAAQANGANNPCNGSNCLRIGSKEFAAVVLFASVPLTNQTRQAGKYGDPSNYLENGNAAPDPTGNKTYQLTGQQGSQTLPFNDILSCIAYDSLSTTNKTMTSCQ